MFQVLFFGSDPDLENDDLWVVCEFEDRDKAFECFNNPFTEPDLQFYKKDTAFIVIQFSGESQKRKNPHYQSPKPQMDEWVKESAHQAGMMGGVESYNDYMGY